MTAAAQQAEIERRNREAKLLEKQGQKEQAAAVRSQPVYAQPVVLPSAVPAVDGMRKHPSGTRNAMSTPTDEQERVNAAPAPSQEQMVTRSGGAASIGFGMSASNWEQGLKIASVLSKSALIPKAYQGKPEDIVVAMQLGAEVGLPPMGSLQSIGVINGKPGLYGDGFLGVIMSKPSYAKHVEYYQLADGTKVQGLRTVDYNDDETKAVAMFWRQGNPEPFVGEFSIGDAKRAKLWLKEGPWQQYPSRQLKWRARGFAGRDGFAAELRGIKMVEELRDTPLPDVTDLPVIEEPVRRSAKVVAATEPDAQALQNTEPRTSTTGEPAQGPSMLETELPPPNGETRKPAGRSVPKAVPAPKATPTTDTPTIATPSLAFTDSAFVQPKAGDPFYELRARVQGKGEAPVGFVFRTRDEQLYKLAESCEGTDRTFTVKWHPAVTPDGTRCKVLDAIESSN